MPNYKCGETICELSPVLSAIGLATSSWSQNFINKKLWLVCKWLERRCMTIYQASCKVMTKSMYTKTKECSLLVFQSTSKDFIDQLIYRWKKYRRKYIFLATWPFLLLQSDPVGLLACCTDLNLNLTRVQALCGSQLTSRKFL